MPLFELGKENLIKEYNDHFISEDKLRTLFESHGLVFIEKGLKFIERNVAAGDGFIDTFAIDFENRPVIIEYKVNENASPSALTQALSYAYRITESPDGFVRRIMIKLNDPSIKEDDVDYDNLRIVLVAPAFEKHVLEAANMVEPHIKLVTYKTFKSSQSECISVDTVYDSFAFRRAPSSNADYTLDQHFLGRKAVMKPIFEKLADDIKSRLNVTPYVKKAFIAFRHNSIFAAIRVYTDKITIDVALPDGETPPSPFRIAPSYRLEYSRITHVADISKPQEVNEELMKWIIKSHENS